jgi:asparagine N-glycosylation enzyme membrane subunit Stt3
MFLEFNPYLVIFWVFLSSFIPGALLALAIFKKNDQLKLVEKILLGFAIGFILPSLIALILNIAGVLYSYNVALVSIAVFYVIAIAAFVKEKAYEGISLPKGLVSYAVPFILLLIVFLSFFIRLQSYSPVYQELDPYYYAYSTQQLVTLGFQPFDDKTAWYPEVVVNHRASPLPHFMEAIWYSLYTQGGAYNNYLLFDVAGIYPAIAAGLLVFLVYLAVSAHYKREYGLLSASLLGFMPIFLIKLAAGEPEIQPYAFFSIAFFIAMYSWALKTKDIRFTLLGALAFGAAAMGSSSLILILAMLLIFVPLQAILLFLKEKTTDELRELVKLNGIILIAGALLFSAVILPIYRGGFGLGSFLDRDLLAIFGVIAFAAFLYYVKQRVHDSETSRYVILGIMMVGAMAVFFTPIGGVVEGIAVAGLQFAKFNYALQQTIAEQNLAGIDFEGQLGFAATTVMNTFFNAGDACNPTTANAALLPMKPFECAARALLNTPFSILTSLLNAILTDDIGYSQKENSVMLVIFFIYFITVLFSIYKNYKGQRTPFLFFLALFPMTFVGILKAKFTIYTGFFFTILAAVALAELEELVERLLKRLKINFQVENHNAVSVAALAIVAMLAVGQFLYIGFAPGVLASSGTQRFQDNPLAAQSKLKLICDQLKFQGQSDDEICGAAADPMGYASKGTNYQFSYKLCAYSLLSSPFAPTNADRQAVSYRCQRLSDYWVDSMEWIRYNTENGSRITSWWDYGHWENFFGQRNAVIRNEHSSTYMIGEVAHAFIDGDEANLKSMMKRFDSKYVLIDQELVLGGLLGGKHGALNYLSCSRDNDTNVGFSPSGSVCEWQHRWEIIYVPKSAAQPCTISESTNKTGIIAYKFTYDTAPSGQIANLRPEPAYCIGETTLADGKKTQATYLLDQKYDNGDLRLNKALINVICNTSNGFDCDDSGVNIAAVLFYTPDPIWVENGEVKSGYADRNNSGTHYYDSMLYKGWFLKNLGPDFDLVYETPGGAVKIFKLND